MDVWTTAEVARLAGVSARTLRHYDAIGLLEPASHGPGGLRRYGRPDQAVVERAWETLQELTPEERRAIPEAFNDINARRRAGKAADDPDVQDVVVDHYRLIAEHWGDRPNAEAYRGARRALHRRTPPQGHLRPGGRRLRRLHASGHGRLRRGQPLTRGRPERAAPARSTR
nr:MerR family DNA-binding transcriptional regulator [Glycomyces sp. YM15]